MDELRRPLFVLALVAMAIAFMLEIGAAAFLGDATDPATLERMASQQLRDMSEDDRRDALAEMRSVKKESGAEPPGYGIPFTALLDALLLLTCSLMGISLIVPERLHGRVQGIVTLIVSLVVLIASILLIIGAIALLLLMIGLLFSPPFGTIAYLAMYGFFPSGAAAALLGATMFFKLAFLVLLISAHQRFLQNKGLILITLCSLLATFLVGLLQSFPPSVLVSITDVVAAIVVAVIAAVWAVVLLGGSVVSIFKAIA